MNTADTEENDGSKDLLAAGESAGSVPLFAGRQRIIDSVRVEQTSGARVDFRGRFLIALLRALSAWTA